MTNLEIKKIKSWLSLSELEQIQPDFKGPVLCKIRYLNNMCLEAVRDEKSQFFSVN